MPPFPVFPLETPALRPLQISPVQHEGRQLLIVQDPMGIIDGPIAIAPDPVVLVLLQLADGKTDVDTIARIAREKTDLIVTADKVRNVIRELDESGMLLSERFLEKWKARRESWDALPIRPATVFEAENREELLAGLDEEFERHVAEPGAPPQRLSLPSENVRAILSPHIDYARGGVSYAWAYKAVREHTKAKTFIVLGTLHRGASHLFIATRKPYETPYGVVEVDKDVLGDIEREFRGELYEEEYLHAFEHTIELQVVYLKRILGDRPFRIVPILVAPIDELLYAQPPVEPSQDPEIDAFAKAIRSVMRKHGDDVVLVGGVDMAHCGPEFGHRDLNDERIEKVVRQQDEDSLRAVEKVDAKGFFDTFRKTMNARNVCSIAPIYTILAALEGDHQGKLLKYEQSNSDDKTCMVTFASVAFVPKSRIILLS